jgi:hypothetical protein
VVGGDCVVGGAVEVGADESGTADPGADDAVTRRSTTDV